MNFQEKVTRAKAMQGGGGGIPAANSITDIQLKDTGIKAVVSSHTEQLANNTQQLGLKTDKTYSDAQLALKAKQADLEATNSNVSASNLRIDNLVIPLSATNTNIEVTDAHVSAVKNKTFTSMKNRLEEIESTTHFPAVNILSNGDFSNGMTNWSPNSGTGTVANNEFTLTINTASSNARIFQTITAIIGHKYYMSANVKYSRAGVPVYMLVGGFSTPLITSIANVYTKHSAIGTVTTTGSFSIYAPKELVSVVGDVATFKYISMIDLTSIYGVGNEPSITDFEAILSRLPNSWFADSASIFNTKDINSLIIESYKKYVPPMANAVPSLALTTSMYKGKSVTEDKVTFISKSINLFDKSNITNGFYIDSGTGVLIANASFWVSDYIEVKTLLPYTLRYKNQMAIFTNDKKYIAGINGYSQDTTVTSTPLTITTDANTQYARISGHISQLETDQFEQGSAFTSFVEFKDIKIDDGLISKYVASQISNNFVLPKKIMSKIFDASKTWKIKLIGDSITHGVGGTGFSQDGDIITTLWGSTVIHKNPNGYCWANLFKSYFESKFTCTVTNNACSGMSTDEAVGNLSTFIADTDDIVICMLGTNNRGNHSTVDFKAQLQTIYDYCASKNIDIIFMASVPSSITNENTYVYHMEDINHDIAKVSYNNKLDYVDVYQGLMDYCDLKNVTIDSLLADGIHPNDAGYKVIFSIICKNLGIALKRTGATW